MKSLRSDFTTLTWTLIPVAIVINVVVGQIVQNVLKLPIYLDSIGTVLVAVLAGPLAGALTGALSNIVWAIVFSSPTSAPFAITALVIGLAAGVLAGRGWFRRALPQQQGLTVVVIFGVVLIVLQWVNSGPIGAALAAALTLLALVLTWLNVFPALIVAGGVLTGILAAIVSAPIAAFVFGGVTGSGTDLLVALFQATGANILQAALGQGLVSDPFDKFVSFIVVFLILRGLSTRLIARFPHSANVLQKDQV
jgi:energy-coupling factor transport system substrate-specific component